MFKGVGVVSRVWEGLLIVLQAGLILSFFCIELFYLIAEFVTEYIF